MPHVLPTLHAALARAKDLHKLKQNEQHLQHALNSSRDISVAIGMLMERYSYGQQEAFEKLRRSARDQRRKAGEVASDIINGMDFR